MRTIEGVWPGSAGGLVETITIDPKVTFNAMLVDSAVLSCCPREAYPQVIAETGGFNADGSHIGSNTLHYRENIYTRSSATPTVAAATFNIIQRNAGCAGEAFTMKLCITVVDVACTQANIIAKNCGVTASYVDIE